MNDDDLYSQIDEPIAVLRKRYLIICDNNCCAALLLDRFYAELVIWEEEESYTLMDGDDLHPFYHTLRELARDLFWIFDVETVYESLLLLANKGGTPE